MSESSSSQLIADAILLGGYIANSQMFGCKNQSQGVVIAHHCLSEGIPLLRWQSQYHLIDGKPSMKADAMLAAFCEEGGLFSWASDGENGVATLMIVKLPAMSGESPKLNLPVSYSMEDAKRAKLVKADGGWVKNPAEMLRARAVSRAMRMYCPSIVAGVYTPEEIEDASGAAAGVQPLTPEAVAQTLANPAAATTANSTAEQPKRGRGRPPGSANKPAEATQQEQAATITEPETQPVIPAETVAADLQADVEAAKEEAKQADPQIERIKKMRADLQIGDDVWGKVLAAMEVKSIEELTTDDRAELEEWLAKRAVKAGKIKEPKDLNAWANAL